MKKISSVAFLGSGSGKAGELMYDLMRTAGRLCAERGVTVVTGAYGGSGMEAPAKGAIEAGGEPIGFGFLGLPANPYIQTFQDCGDGMPIDELSNCVEEQYGRRLARLLMRDAFIIGGYGRIGTVVELAAIVNLNLKIWPKYSHDKTPKRAAILTPEDAMWNTFIQHFVLMQEEMSTKEMFDKFFRIAHTPEAAVDWVLGVTPA